MNTAVDHFSRPDPGRVPPHNFDAEQALLGAIMTNNLAYSRVSDFLKAEHFANQEHAEIFNACGLLIEKGKIANPLTLKTHFENLSNLNAVGGVQYLARLAASATTIINAADYGRIVFETCMRRCLITLGEDTVNDAYDNSDPDETARDVMERFDQRLTSLMTEGTTGGGLVPVGTGLDGAIDWVEQAYKSQGKLTGVPTGLSDLDAKIGGLRAENLIILGARPSMGKSTVAITIARNAALAMVGGNIPPTAGKGVSFFSQEMSKEELSTVLMASTTGISADRQLNGRINEPEMARLVQASRSLRALPIHIDDTASLTVAAIRARCRQRKRRGELGLVIIDYLQLIKPEGRRPSGNRVEDVSQITRDLKGLAKELKVPVIALSQLSREVEKREDKRPMLADLRESGSIEQDADGVWFLYRPSYYLERAEPGPEAKPDAREAWERRMAEAHNVCEIIIPKFRMGSTGTVKVFYDHTKSQVGNLTRDQNSSF